jgi:tellurite resistance protein TerC
MRTLEGAALVNTTDPLLIRLVRRLLPVNDTYYGARFTVVREGRRLLTPLPLVLIMIEFTDVLFAVDSIPATFGITRDPFIVYTSNVCAILGLRSLYFLLAGVVHKFVYLKPAHLTAIATWTFIGLASVFAVGGFQRLLDFFPAL